MSTQISKILTYWYLQNKRDLPWRNSADPYHIWLSEIILQQTKVAQGLPYFLRFSEKFPTVFDLANATEENVLKLWQGLGYYSRARNLHAAAKMVVTHYNGEFPTTFSELIKLKGVGVYTASAIASFAANEPVAVVDGNVYRVLSRIFGIFTPINSTNGEKEFKKLADSVLNTKDAATHNQAIMEFGALQCTPKKPKCEICPLNNRCYAFKKDLINELPVKIKKNKVTKKYFTYYIVTYNNEILINKREGKGIWRNLYEFPLFESNNKVTLKEVKQQACQLFKISYAEMQLIEKAEKAHKLSHQHIFADFYEVSLTKEQFHKIDGDFIKINIEEIEKYPVPVLISKFLEKYILNSFSLEIEK